jgi:hypothetical protein
LSYFFEMKRNATRRDAVPDKPPRKIAHTFNKAFDGRGHRVRGLWERNGMYYAQVRTDDWVGQVPLHGFKTVPQALAERQVLKSRIDAGDFIPPPTRKELEKPKPEPNNPRSGSSWDAIHRWLAPRPLMQHPRNSRFIKSA